MPYSATAFLSSFERRRPRSRTGAIRSAEIAHAPVPGFPFQSETVFLMKKGSIETQSTGMRNFIALTACPTSCIQVFSSSSRAEAAFRTPALSASAGGFSENMIMAFCPSGHWKEGFDRLEFQSRHGQVGAWSCRPCLLDVRHLANLLSLSIPAASSEPACRADQEFSLSGTCRCRPAT